MVNGLIARLVLASQT